MRVGGGERGEGRGERGEGEEGGESPPSTYDHLFSKLRKKKKAQTKKVEGKQVGN